MAAAAKPSPPTQRRPTRQTTKPKNPVLGTTRYDLASAAMIAVVIGFVALTTWVMAIWLANQRIKTEDDTLVENIDLGGFEDGAPDETLKVESPEDPTDDPAVEEAPDETQIEEVVENVVELSDQAAQQVPTQTSTASENSGKVGSADGIGRRPLGSGGGKGNRAQRWFIRLGDKGTIDEYARQLDHFKITLGLLKKGQKTLTEMSNLSSGTASKVSKTGANLKGQYYFTWAAGGRKAADMKLIRDRGKLDPRDGLIFHFYTRNLIQKLATMERDAAKEDGRSQKDIVRVYFSVQKASGGYEFVITKVIYK